MFLDTVALLGTPAIIALPARIKVMTLQLWQFPVQAEVAAAYAIPLILITVALFAAQRMILGRRGYVALTGKGGSRVLLQFGAVSRVVAPLLKTSLVGAWLLVFIPATRELSTAIFLVSAQTRVISVMMLDLSENGSFETLAALGFFLLGVTILIVLAGYRVVGRDFMLRRS